MDNPYAQDPRAAEPEYATYGASESNPLGIVGFILALTCLLAPIGLLISIIALFKRPKGFAIAGTIVGLLFSIPHAFIGYAVGSWYGMSPGEIVAASTTTEAGTILFEVEKERASTGSTPTSLDGLNLSQETREDHWGNPYRFEVDSANPTNWTLSSAGPDGVFGTPDDLNDLEAFSTNQSQQRAFVESFDQSVDPDQFDRAAARAEMQDAMMTFIRTIIGSENASTDPAPPAESPSGSTPETPETP
jgi:hypothetical protein